VTPRRVAGIHAQPSLGRRLDFAARVSVPTASTATVLLLLAMPLGLPGQAQWQHAAALCCVFFWSLFRPASMPPLAVFALGLLADLLAYAPLGVSVLIWLIAHGLAMRWRRGLTRLGFVLVWFAFVAVAIMAAFLEWSATSLLSFTLLPMRDAFLEAAIAIGVYPFIAIGLTWAHQTIADPDHA
jgi:rod shape-determining protein MreD